MTKELREFDRSLPMRLLKAREAVMRNFLPSLREHDLSAQQWRVLRALVEGQDRDASEISEQTGSPRGTILSHIHRARQKLAKALGSEFRETK